MRIPSYKVEKRMKEEIQKAETTMEKEMKLHITVITVGILWMSIVYSMIFTSVGALLTTID